MSPGAQSASDPGRPRSNMFETFDHTADLGLRVRAESLEALFEDAARGLFSVLVANLAEVRAVQEKTYRVEGESPDYLLFDWLNELLYTFETEKLLLGEFQVRFDGGGLFAACRGEPVDAARHVLDHEVKAITYHGLKVERAAGGDWLAEVIVDI
jgi:SHS2 domain-containing protein